MTAALALSTLAGVAIKATIVFAIALAADVLLLRRASAAARHLAWSLALAAALLLPALGALLPAWRVASPVFVGASPASTSARVAEPSIVPERDGLTQSRITKSCCRCVT